MSYLSAFVGGVAKQRLSDINAAEEENRALSRYEKQLEVQEKMRQKAEEARVAATRTFLSGGDMGPPQLMAQDLNARGVAVGSARPASQFEKEDYTARSQVAAGERALAADKQRMETEDRAMKKEKHKSGLARDAASIESSRARAASSRAYADNLKSGGLSGRPSVDPFKDESDLAYLVGTKEGGAEIDAEYQAELAKAVNGAQAMGVDEAKLALTRREIARIFINKLKRLPNKAKEE
jgi:hypothetical protein